MNDLDYIISILKRELPCGYITDWYWTLGFLQANRVDVLFFDECNQLGIELPHDVEKLLANKKRQNEHRYRVFDKYIDQIGQAFEENNIKYAFIKGAVISHALLEQKITNMGHFHYLSMHGEPNKIVQMYSSGQRISNDIDILLDPSCLSMADKILRSMGFDQGYWDEKQNVFCKLPRAEIVKRRMTRGETAPYILAIDDPYIRFIEVDINLSLDELPGSSPLLSKMLDNTKLYQARTPGRYIRGLSQEHMLIQLMLHQRKEMGVYWMLKRNKGDLLYKYMDIYKMLNSNTYNALNFYHEVKNFELCDEVCMVIETVHNIFGTTCSIEAGLLLAENPDDKPIIVTDYLTKSKYINTVPVKKRLSKRITVEGLVPYHG